MNELKQLIRALRRIAPDNHRCLVCGFEHDCGIHGCRIIQQAASRLERLQTSLRRIQKMHENVKGCEKALLGEVLELIGGDNE